MEFSNKSGLIEIEIKKAQKDKKSYRIVNLPSGLEVLLISTAATLKGFPVHFLKIVCYH